MWQVALALSQSLACRLPWTKMICPGPACAQRVDAVGGHVTVAPEQTPAADGVGGRAGGGMVGYGQRVGYGVLLLNSLLTN